MVTLSIQEQLQAARINAQEAVAAKIAEAKAKAELALLTNEKFLDAMVQQSIKSESTSKLDELVTMCESIVEDNKVYSKTLKANRVFNPSKRYEFGHQFALLSGLITGMQYSVAEHLEMMLAVTGLTRDMLETFIAAMGQLPYYSARYGVVVEGTPVDLDNLTNILNLVEVALGVQVDKSLLTQDVADKAFMTAQAKADKAEAEAALGDDVAGLVIR